MSKKWKILLTLFVFLLPGPILAMELHNKENITVSKDDVIEGNYYAVGEKIDIYGAINGDVFLAGQDIFIDSDNINGDIFILAKNITVRGQMNGSLRMVAAENMFVLAQDLKNVMAVGRYLRVDPEAYISRHLTFWGESLAVSGDVGGEIEGAAENFKLDSKVGGDVDMYLSSSNGKVNLNLTDKASIGGTLYYKSLEELELNSQAYFANEPVYNQIEKNNKFDWFGELTKFFQLLVLGMIFIYIAPKYLHNIYKKARKYYWKLFFKGLGFVFVLPIICLLLALTVIGIPLAIIMLVFWLIAVYLGQVMSAWLLGSFINDKIIKKKKMSQLMMMAIGIFCIMLISYIPIVGFIFLAFVYLVSWGIFYASFYKLKKK